tara:strand:- start:1205 stop:1450 length:246 start_codon:yes stop_codon:yes gene_type:complete
MTQSARFESGPHTSQPCADNQYPRHTLAEQVFAEKTSDAEICHYDAFIDKMLLEELWLEAKSGCHMTVVISYGIVEWQRRV